MSSPAPYAASDANTRGRRHPEPRPEYRSEYQRDRDRIVHSAAFRRLEYKTQVFVNHEGDMFRTRLTHSLEVAQIARTIARALGANEDLTEAIALAHDLGHTPFGHAGQDALNECMSGHGGFEHNLQSLRVVETLELRYAAFTGLNLTFETREGILKHCTRTRAEKLGEIARRFLDGSHPSLEAQIANLADEIAYNNHDIDDGLRSGLIEFDALRELALFHPHLEEIEHRWPQLERKRLRSELTRRVINEQVTDLVECTRERLAALEPDSIEAIRTAGSSLVQFTDAMHSRHTELKRFLHRHLYRHARVHRMSVKARRIVKGLFEAFTADARLLPEETREAIEAPVDPATGGDDPLPRVVADYVAGMTDRFAIAEYRRIFDPVELP